MWNERYKDNEYVYGTEPNTFLVEHSKMFKGPVLSLAEGEGRNAVYLASLGLDVHAVDLSEVGLMKAQALAKSKGVSIETEVADLGEFEPAVNHYESVVSIFAHLPKTVRSKLYPRVEDSLKSGGLIILEAYSEAQLSRDTGGPKDVDLLMTAQKINEEFSRCTPILLREVERDVFEGKYHTGKASVVQFIGRKE